MTVTTDPAFLDMDHDTSTESVRRALLAHGPMRMDDIRRFVDPLTGRHLAYFLTVLCYRDDVIAGPFERGGRVYQARQR